MDKQINQPQDINVPQSESNKSAEEICKLMVDECPFIIRPSVEPYIIESMKLYAAQFQSRITQLEAGLKQCQSDRDDLQKSNDRIEKKNSELREVLTKVCASYRESCTSSALYLLIIKAEQALNSKDK